MLKYKVSIIVRSLRKQRAAAAPYWAKQGASGSQLSSGASNPQPPSLTLTLSPVHWAGTSLFLLLRGHTVSWPSQVYSRFSTCEPVRDQTMNPPMSRLFGVNLASMSPQPWENILQLQGLETCCSHRKWLRKLPTRLFANKLTLMF